MIMITFGTYAGLGILMWGMKDDRTQVKVSVPNTHITIILDFILAICWIFKDRF